MTRPPRQKDLSRRVRLASLVAGIGNLVGYTAGLDTRSASRRPPPANVSLAPWLLEHHLTYGLSGYWTSSSVTVDSGGRVQIRALLQFSLKRDLWMSNVSWYDPKLHYADFIVLDSRPGFMNHWEPRALRPEVFRPSCPDLSHRPLHRAGLEQEPAQQHPAVRRGPGEHQRGAGGKFLP